MHDAWLQALGLFCSLCGMGWLALAMEAHWKQALGASDGPGARDAAWLRVLAAIAFAASLGLFMATNHASIAALAWIMSLVVAAFVVAFVLSWRPSQLAWLARVALRRCV